MTIRIENSKQAKSNRLYSRVIPIIITIAAGLNLLVSLIRGPSFFALFFSVLWIVYMVILLKQKGSNTGVEWIEFGDKLYVNDAGLEKSHYFSEVKRLEYEGIGNPARALVTDAPFPKDGERILVVRLRTGVEYRANVRYEHDQPLKKIAQELVESEKLNKN